MLEPGGRRHSVAEITKPNETRTLTRSNKHNDLRSSNCQLTLPLAHRVTSPMLATVVRVLHALEGSPRPVPFDLVRMHNNQMDKLTEAEPAYILHSSKVTDIRELASRVVVGPDSRACFEKVVQGKFLQNLSSVHYIPDDDLLNLLILLVFKRPTPWVVVCTLQPKNQE